MIPTLFPADHDYQSRYPMGGQIGRLSETLSCEISENLDGIYELKLEYPTDGEFSADLMNPGMIAASRPEVAVPNGYRNAQGVEWFDIYRRTVENNIITVLAGHVSYRLSRTAVFRVPATDYLDGAIVGMTGNLTPSNDFAIRTDEVYEDDGTGHLSPTKHLGDFACSEIKTAREYIFDDVYSFRKIYNVDAICTSKEIWLVSHRGEDRGVEIRYGKNLISGTISYDSTETYNAIMGYWKGIVEGYEHTVSTWPYIAQSPTPSKILVLPIDFSSYFENEPTQTELINAVTKYLNDNAPWNAKISADITFTPEWIDGATDSVRENIELGDTVTVFYGSADFAGAKMRVVKTKYDSLLERYTEYTLGELQKQYAVTSRDGISATRQIMA